MKVLSIFGTRPEAIKMAPLLGALQREPGIQSILCSTGQHREMLAQAVSPFDLTIHHELNVMSPGQSLNQLTSRLLAGLDKVLDAVRPDCVLVHGDSSSAAAGALAAFHQQVPIGHIEAGLRTGDPTQPFPEEMNRRLIDSMSTWLFAPTVLARRNLESENLRGRIWVTGNTGIDSVAAMRDALRDNLDLAISLAGRYTWVDQDRKLVLVTSQRRENRGAGLRNVCEAVAALACRPDVQIIYALHLDPDTRDSVMDQLGGRLNIHLVEPLGYPAFVWFMQQAALIVTDSGGIQEEAAFLGKPLLITRATTERPEDVDLGAALLVGTDQRRIVREAERLLDDDGLRRAFAHRANPFGDGHACDRIVAALCGRRVAEFEGLAA